MHHHAGRLVEDGDVFVLVQDPERNVLRHRFRRARGGHLDDDRFAGPHRMPRLEGHAVHPHEPALDQGLHARAGEAVERGGQKPVKALAGIGHARLDPQGFG